MANKITYTDKEYLLNDTSVPDKNKVLDTDMNQIKSVVNNNADELDTAKQDISDLETEQTTQNNNIQTNANNISTINTKLGTIETGAEVNVIEDVKVNGTSLTVTSKAVNVEVPTKTSDISNDSGYITKEVNDLTYYTLTTQTGSQIELTLNTTNFKMTATLKDKNGNVVNTSNEIDLPLESVIVNASYDSTTKELVLTLQNGNTVRVSIADLVSGLQTEITSSNKLASDLVDDSTSTNKFVTSEDKTNWNNKLDNSKVKTTTSTTAGEVYDVTYINTMIGDIETILTELDVGGGVE